jgi:diguanylate cyclase (GGDEF)-like protein
VSGAASKRPRTVEDLERENARLQRELELLRALAYHDPLTSLWNRRYCDERLREELSRASRATGRAFSVVVADMNDLKKINDEQGHAAGDRAIRWVGKFLRDTLRTHDVCCRTGGDEFTMILPETSALDCEKLVARLRQALAAAQESSGGAASLGLSFGAASFPKDGTGAAEILDRADAAMYLDKRTQKGGPSPLVSRISFD